MAASASELFSVKGLVCVITGGGSGIGRWTADAFDVNGAAKVFILGRRTEVLQRVAKDAVSTYTTVPILCLMRAAKRLDHPSEL